MSKKHSPGFERICEDARSRVREVSVDEVYTTLQTTTDFVLIDIREDHEWDEGRIPGSTHLGKGIIERDIETTVPDFNKKMILYCGGGYRSVLAADALQKMGYTNVRSMADGFRGWNERKFPVKRSDKR